VPTQRRLPGLDRAGRLHPARRPVMGWSAARPDAA
jgi:hypothetical protein